MDELKPCPKCGSNQVAIDYRWDSLTLSKTYFVYCRSCDTYFNGNYSEDSTIAKWNTRPAEDELKAKNEKLKSDLEIQKNLTKQMCFENNRAYQETEKWKKMFYDLINKQSSISTDPKVIVVGTDTNVPTKESEVKDERVI